MDENLDPDLQPFQAPEIVKAELDIFAGTQINTKDLPDSWGVKDPKRKKIVEKAIKGAKAKHGILSSIPMICRDHECPYKDFCVPQQTGQVVYGERCVKEIGEILESAQRYYGEFGINPVDPGARVDVSQVSFLISLEVLIRRCEMLLAKGDLVELVETAIDPRSGESVMQPQLHKAADALPKFQRRHSEILRDLNATRKEKLASSSALGMSIDQYNREILQAGLLAQERLSLMREGKYEEAEKIIQKINDLAIEGNYKELG